MDPKRRGGLGRSIYEAEPSPGHLALAEMEGMGLVKTLITPNIDNLHFEAGSVNVLEIHGARAKLRCIKCNARFSNEDFYLLELLPMCPACGGVVNGDTVMFGEPIPRARRYQRRS